MISIPYCSTNYFPNFPLCGSNYATTRTHLCVLQDTTPQNFAELSMLTLPLRRRVHYHLQYTISLALRRIVTFPFWLSAILVLCLVLICISPLPAQASGQTTPPEITYTQTSSSQQRAPATSANAATLLAPLLNIPYRADGAITREGAYTTFANPSKQFTTPGLNCSGFVLAASRLLISTPLTVENAGYDRWNDSGPDSPHGHDWDYGWDLVSNIVGSLDKTAKARFLVPKGGYDNPLLLDGFAAKGYDLHAQGQLDAALARMKQHHLYLISFNKSKARAPHIPQHYHVGFIVLNEQNAPLLYQTTTQRKRSYVRNLATAQGRASFLKAFANTKHSRKHMAIVEIPMR